MSTAIDRFFETEIRARLRHVHILVSGQLQRANQMAATMQQVLDDLDEIKTEFDAYVTKRDKIDDDLRAEIAKLVAANPALQAQVDSAFQKAEAQKKLLTMTVDLPDSFVDKADFVKQVDLYNGGKRVDLDGNLYVGGDEPALTYFSHSADGHIDNVPPTN